MEDDTYYSSVAYFEMGSEDHVNWRVRLSNQMEFETHGLNIGPTEGISSWWPSDLINSFAHFIVKIYENGALITVLIRYNGDT